MRRRALWLALLLGGLVSAARADTQPPLPPTTPLFTIAGGTGPGSGLAVHLESATAARFPGVVRIAARSDGSIVLAADGGLLTVDPAGRITPLASDVWPSAVAVAPDGNIVFAGCEQGESEILGAGTLVRTAPGGPFTRLAGSGRLGANPRDGTPALEANLSCPQDIASAPDGRIFFDSGGRVLELGTDGLVRTVAGTGRFPDSAIPQAGGPARKVRLDPSGLDVESDGTLLIADPAGCRLYRLDGRRLTVIAGNGRQGRRRDDGARAVDARVCPIDVAAVPGGGFFVIDAGTPSESEGDSSVRLVQPDGRIRTVAGGARLSIPRGYGHELRGDGMPALQADLRHLVDIALLADGGVAFTESDLRQPRSPGLVRYLPPQRNPRLAVGVRRDRDRIYAPGAATFTTVSLTAPADVAVSVLDGDRLVATRTASLPAGDTRIELPSLAAVPHTISVSAQDAGGRVADDRAAILPRGWLATSLARSLAEQLLYVALDRHGYFGDGLGRCRRLAPGRVDCALRPERRCAAVVTIRLGGDGRLRWGTYRCPISISARRFVKRPRALRRGDLRYQYPPLPLFGRVADRWLVPWD